MIREITPPPFDTYCKNPQNLLPNLPTQPQQQQVFPETPKRGRGRPKKSHVPPPTEETTQQEGEIIPSPSEKQVSTPVQFQIKTRSQLKQLSDTEKADYFAVSFIESLKQLVKKKKTLKNGSTKSSWTTQQKRAFKLYGDIYGRTVKGHEPMVDRGDQNPMVPPGLPQNQDPNDPFELDPEDFDEFDQEGGYETPEEGEEENPEGQEDAPGPAGAMLPLPQEQLPLLPGAQQPQQQGAGKNNPEKIKGPSPPLQLPPLMEMPPGAQPVTPDSLPSSPIQPIPPQHHKDNVASKTKIGQLPPTKNPFMGLFKDPKLEEVKTESESPSTSAAGAIPKSTPAKSRRSWADFGSPTDPDRKPSSVGLMAELIGLSPSEITKKARTELVGDLVRTAMSPPMPKLAQRDLHGDFDEGHTNLERPNPILRAQTSDGATAAKGEKGEASPPNSTPDTRRRHLEESIADLQKRLADAQAKQAQLRPTRSTYKAPDIDKLPPVPLEKLIKKELKDKNKIKSELKSEPESDID